MHLIDRIGRRIKLQDVHVLMAVVQAGSMGKAARHLNTSQPNISKSIADLERALGVRLLDRHRQGIEPTEFGRALLDGGTAVFDELRQTVKNIEFLADPAAGEVRIGSNPLLAASFTAAVVDRLSRYYPRVKFHLSTGYVDALYRELSERNVDLLIALKLGPIADVRLSFEFLFDDSCVVVAAAQSPWASRRRVKLAELINEPWVMSPLGSGISSIAMKAFAAAGLDQPRMTIITDSPHVRMNLLATGRYLTIFPASTVRLPTPSPQLKVLPVSLPMDPVPTGIVTLKDRTLIPVARLFIETAREIAKQMPKKKL
jgi:DNA-binding transcriptional LysR family regulator